MSKVLKDLKKSGGKVVFDGPKIKERKKFAPATKVEKSKKTYDRSKQTFEEDEEKKDCWKGYKKKGTKMKGNKKVNNCVEESTSEHKDIKKFLDHLVFNNYAEANKCLQRVLEKKLSEKIKAELNTPLF
jgi:hypothetical protein